MSESTGSDSTHGTLATTARWIAAVRAKESERADRLFEDPFARILAGEAGLSWIEGRSPDSYVSIAIRGRYFDDYIQHVAREYRIRQFVLLGAGMDTRAYRLPWPPDSKVFEIDQPSVLDEKNAVLAASGAVPSCDRRPVGTDLSGDWLDSLRAAGYDDGLASLWLMEGILFYLPSGLVESILDSAIALSPTGSHIAFDVVNSVMLTSPLTRQWVDMQAAAGAPWLSTLDDPIGYLSGRGVEATVTQAGAPDANYGRWPFPVFPVLSAELPHSWYVTGRKK